MQYFQLTDFTFKTIPIGNSDIKFSIFQKILTGVTTKSIFGVILVSEFIF